ncbi:MAG: hypothetical protein ACRET6_01525 [Burkholderiales bacterium]
MNCHLLVPELFWPAAAGAEPYRGLALPALETLLARGARTRVGGASLERWLGAAHGFSAELPLAPYSLRGDGVEPGDHWWLRADPVHLKVHGDRLVLADASRLEPTADEARQYVATLNAHFAGEGMTFVAPGPLRWYARVASEPRLGTLPTTEVAGRSVASFLPSGSDGARWRKAVNEMQMLLHDHPCNSAREARGQLPVNSIWLWGGGREGRPATPYGGAWADHPLVAGLAAASGFPARPLPASGALLDTRGGGTQLVVLASLPMPAYGDLPRWREALAALEQNWFAPLLNGLQKRAIESLTLHGLGPDFGYASEIRPRDRWRFWRARRPLHAYAA